MTDLLIRAILALLTVPSSLRLEQPYQWAYCRRAPNGCEARVRAIVEHIEASARAWQLDPYLLAAVAWEESRWNPAARGPGGECGLMQLHPARRDTKAIPFCRDKRVRERCLREADDACQRLVIDVGAAILRRSIDDCGGDVMGGLWRYHTGQRRCIESRYGRRVMATVQRLKQEEAND